MKAIFVVFLVFFLGAGSAQADITSKEDWNAAFTAAYGDGTDFDILLSQNGYNDKQSRFAWHGNYWVRAEPDQ